MNKQSTENVGTESFDGLEQAEKLLSSANDTSRHVRNVYLTFIFLLFYVAIIIGSTTDVQLLKIEPITLPFFSVAIPIVGFYALSPWLITLLHFNMLMQLSMLATNLRALHQSIKNIASEKARSDIRSQLFPLHFSQMYVDGERSWLMNKLLKTIVWITILWLPLIVLLWLQLRFLPYHDESVTWSQRGALILDFILLWSIWPIIMSSSGDASEWWKGYIALPKRTIRTLLTLLHNLWKGINRIEIRRVFKYRFKLREIIAGGKKFSIYSQGKSTAYGAVTLTLTTMLLLPFSLLVATIPQENMEIWLANNMFDSWLVSIDEKGTVPSDALINVREGEFTSYFIGTYWIFDKVRARKNRSKFNDYAYSPFRRYLQLNGEILIKNKVNVPIYVLLKREDEKERQKALNEVIGIDLRGRDLRYAKLAYSSLPAAQLSGAILDGADMRKAFLPESELDNANLNGVDLGYANLEGANLQSASILGSMMNRVNLLGADLIKAKLQGAYLNGADLRFSYLNFAHLQGVSMIGARLFGASLNSAHLQGADLTRAKIQFAYLRGASLQGVKMVQSELYASDFRGVMFLGGDLTDADVSYANFKGAKFEYAKLIRLTSDTERSKEEIKISSKLLSESLSIDSYIKTRVTNKMDNLRAERKPKDRIPYGKDTQQTLCNKMKIPEVCFGVSRLSEYEEELVKFLTGLSCESSGVANGIVRSRIRSGRGTPSLDLRLAESLYTTCKENAKFTHANLNKLESILITYSDKIKPK